MEKMSLNSESTSKPTKATKPTKSLLELLKEDKFNQDTYIKLQKARNKKNIFFLESFKQFIDSIDSYEKKINFIREAERCINSSDKSAASLLSYMIPKKNFNEKKLGQDTFQNALAVIVSNNMGHIAKSKTYTYIKKYINLPFEATNKPKTTNESKTTSAKSETRLPNSDETFNLDDMLPTSTKTEDASDKAKEAKIIDLDAAIANSKPFFEQDKKNSATNHNEKSKIEYL
jgi:hypothetical protein